MHVALVVLAFIHYGKGALEKLGCHAKQGTHPHPEYCARAAHGYGDCHAGNVAHAHGAAYGAHQSLETAYLPLALLLGAQRTNGSARVAQWYQSRVEKQKESAANQPDEQWVATNKIGDSGEPVAQ